MANFNKNLWYQIYLNDSKMDTLVGTPLYDKDSAAAFVGVFNAADSEQFWQFYAVDSDYYVLRTRKAGPDAFLGVTLGTDDKRTTVATMARGRTSDDSVYWKMTPWGDGTFHMSNKKNKTEWHLARVAPASPILVMDSNVTGRQEKQRWSFESLKESIENPSYSTIALPNTSLTSASISSTANTVLPSTGNTGRPSNTPLPNAQGNSTSGLRKGEIAGIVVSASLAFLVSAILILSWLRRKKKQRNQVVMRQTIGKHDPPIVGNVTLANFELPGHSYAEMPVNPNAVEMPLSVPPTK